MYIIRFDGYLQFPIAPESIETKIKGNNATSVLINGGEINEIKNSKLTEFSFDVLLPLIKNYPFATYRCPHQREQNKTGKAIYDWKDDGFQPANYYLDILEGLKVNKKSFTLCILRTTPKGKNLFGTTMLVTLENYTIKEDANEGFDIKVSIELKKYVKYGTVKVKLKNGKLTKKQIKRIDRKLPLNYVIKKGDTLHNIAKKQYTSGDKVYRNKIYNANKKVIENAAKKHGKKTSVKGKYLYKGTKIVIPKI